MYVLLLWNYMEICKLSGKLSMYECIYVCMYVSLQWILHLQGEAAAIRYRRMYLS